MSCPMAQAIPYHRVAENTEFRDPCNPVTGGSPAISKDVTTHLVNVGGVLSKSSSPDKPPWHDRIKQCKSATSSLYSRCLTFKVLGPADYTSNIYRASDGCERWRSVVHGFPLPVYTPLAIPDDLEDLMDYVNNLALEDFAGKLQDTRRQFMAGVSGGELRETLQALRDPGKALKEGITHWLIDARKDRACRPRGDHLRWSRDTWLEYNLAWRPLASDIESAFDALNQLAYRDALTCEKVTAKAEDQRDSHGNSHLPITPKTGWDMESLLRESVSVRYQGAMRFVNNDRRTVMYRAFGLEAADFVPTLWELIPFSFVVDYFGNIGDMLNSWSLNRAEVGWAEVQRKSTRYSKIYPVQTYGSGYYSSGGSGSLYAMLSGTPGAWESTHEIKTRDPYTGTLIPSFRFRMPGFASQWANVAALFSALTDRYRKVPSPSKPCRGRGRRSR